MWRPIDAIAGWIGRRLDYRWQMRLGVLSLLLGCAFFAYMPFSEEPPAIFAMSALALVFGAAGVIAAVEAAREASSE